MSRRTAYALGVLTGALSLTAGAALGCWLHYRTFVPA